LADNVGIADCEAETETNAKEETDVISSWKADSHQSNAVFCVDHIHVLMYV